MLLDRGVEGSILVVPPTARGCMRLLSRSRLAVTWLACALMLFAGAFLAARAIRENELAAATPALMRNATLVEGVRYVTAAQALDAAKAENSAAPIFIDVRTSKEFAAAHISGALNIQVFVLPDLVGQLPRDRAWVLYCACPDDRLAIQGAAAIGSAHPSNAVVLQHGLEAWRHAGGEVTTAGDVTAVASEGCGCSVGAEAVKLWIIGRAQADEQEAEGRTR